MEDYYTIQTPEHHSSLFYQLHSLQKQGVMCDVILAAEDGEVMAHKVILMAVSRYFREKLSPIVSSTPTRVFLKGIPVIELANLVKYVYTGKLLIAKETMDVTLEVAEILHLNGVINGYKEILAYEQMKAPKSSLVTVVKEDKDSSNFNTFNIQIDGQTAETARNGQQEQYYAESEQKMDSASFTEGVSLANDAATVSEQVVSTQAAAHNTSAADFAFETNLYENQYYDVSVGSSVSIPVDTQVNTMPSLQKMSNAVSMDDDEAHQDLLSVAIETLTDANYLSSPPGKDARQIFTSSASQAVPTGLIYSNAETSSLPIQSGESVPAIPSTQVSTTALADTGGVVSSSTTTSKSTGNIPVYRVSLPPSMDVHPIPKQPRGRPRSVNVDNQTGDSGTRGRPRRSLVKSENRKIREMIVEESIPKKMAFIPKKEKGERLIVSPMLTRHSPRQAEKAQKTPDTTMSFSPAKLKEKSVSSATTVNSKKTIDLTSESHKEKKGVDDELIEIVDDIKANVSEQVGEFGQSVNFDSDDDDNDAVDTGVEVTELSAGQVVAEQNDAKLPEIGKEGSAGDQKVSDIEANSKNEKENVKDTASETGVKDAQSGTVAKEAVGVTEADKLSDGVQKVQETKAKAPLIQEDRSAKANKQQEAKQKPETEDKKQDKSAGEAEDLNKDRSEKGSNQIKMQTRHSKGTENSVEFRSPRRRSPSKVEKNNVDESKDLTKLKTPKRKIRSAIETENGKFEESQSKNRSSDLQDNDCSVVLKTPKGKSEFIIEIDNPEMDVTDSIHKDIRSSASKRKCKLPRRLTDYEKPKGKMGPNIPMVRTRKYSKNEGSTQEDMQTSNKVVVLSLEDCNKDETVNDEGVTEMDGKESVSPNTTNAKLKSKKVNLQPVVKLEKQSTGEIMDMARQIAVSKSPKKRRKIEVDVQPAESNEPAKKKSKKPTELPPVAALKNRQKIVEGNEDDDSVESIKSSTKNTKSLDSRSEVQISCNKCDKSFRYRIQLNKHMKFCKGKTSVRNIFDDIKQSNEDEQEDSTQERSSSGTPDPESIINVEIIEFGQAEGKELDQLGESEKSNEERDKLYVCSEVGCKFSSESSLIASKHQKIHIKTLKCGECDRLFRSHKSFEKHRKSCCRRECFSCGQVFLNMKDLRKHRLDEHKDEFANQSIKPQEIRHCVFCDEEFTDKKKLYRHEAVHEEVKDLHCKCCNQAWLTLRDYKIHLTTQKRRSVENVCTICNKMFSRAGDQRKHMFKFHNIRPDDKKSAMKMFRCDICSFIGWTKKTLENHKKAHTGVKDVPCPHCKKMYVSQYDVNRHMKMVHGGFKGRFKCIEEGCSFSTSTKKCLQTHTKLKHSEEKEFLVCRFCGYQTQLKGNLDKHIQKVHKLEVVKIPKLKDIGKYENFKPGTIITPDGRDNIEESDIGSYRKNKSLSADLKDKETPQKPRKRRPKTIEEFTQHIMAQHMKRLATPETDKDYLSPVLTKAINMPQFPQASTSVRRHRIAMEKGIGDVPKVFLRYDQMDVDVARQYTDGGEVGGLEQEIIVEDGIVPVPSAGVSMGNEVYIIEAGKSDNIIEGDELMHQVTNELEDETSRSLRLLTSLADGENEDETTRSLRVLTTLLEAGQTG